jgi:SAM-dependent methyltransferase
VPEQLRTSGTDLCAWRGRGAEASALATKAVHHLLLVKALERLRPETVLEVGSGNGLQLFLLAGAFPRTRFSGLELSEAGVRAAERVQGLETLPDELRRFAAAPVRDPAAHRRVELHRGSAAELPFADASFDLVYTSLALEQMEAIRDRALGEIARVARAHVVMIEPFRDFNAEGIRHDYVRSRDIFSARVADVERFGLKPVFTFSDFPSKLSLGVGLVIAEKSAAPLSARA